MACYATAYEGGELVALGMNTEHAASCAHAHVMLAIEARTIARQREHLQQARAWLQGWPTYQWELVRQLQGISLDLPTPPNRAQLRLITEEEA